MGNKRRTWEGAKIEWNRRNRARMDEGLREEHLLAEFCIWSRYCRAVSVEYWLPIRNDHLSSGNQYTFNWLIFCKVTQRGTGSQWRIARNDEPRGVLTTLWIRRIIVYSWLQEYLCRPLCIRNYEISGAIWSARRITLMRIWSKFFGIWKVWGNVGIALWGTPYVDRSRSNRWCRCSVGYEIRSVSEYCAGRLWGTFGTYRGCVFDWVVFGANWSPFWCVFELISLELRDIGEVASLL